MAESSGNAEPKPLVANLGAMVEFAHKGIVSKTLLDTAYTKVVLFCMETGQSLSEHTASMPAAIHVLDGHGQVRLGDEAYEARQGVWIHMPAETRHAVTADYNLVFLLTLFKPY